VLSYDFLTRELESLNGLTMVLERLR